MSTPRSAGRPARGLDNARCLDAWMRMTTERVLLTDASGRILKASRAFRGLLSKTLEDVEGTPIESWLSQWAKGQDRVWAEAVARAAATSAEQDMELHRKAEDTEETICVRITPVPAGTAEEDACLLSTWLLRTPPDKKPGRPPISEHLLALLDSLPELVCVQARDGTIRYANRAFKDLLGEPGARCCYEMFAGRTTPCPSCPFRELAEGAECEGHDLSLGDRTCRVSDAPFLDVHGEKLRLIMGVDVTDLKAEEAQLSQRARQLEKTNAGLEEANARIQKAHVNLSSAHTNLERMNDKLAQANRDLEHEIAERKQAEAALRERTEELEFAYAELEDSKAKRQEAWAAAESTNTRLEDVVAKLARANKALEQQIQDRRTVEESLRRSEEWTRSIINASKDAMITIDAHGLVTVFNAAAEKMFGREASEMLGKSLECLMPEEYRHNHAKDVESFFRTGKPDTVIGCTIEVPGLRSSGEQFPMEISLTAGGTGDRRFVLGIMRDITERRQVAQRQEEYAANLELVNAMVREANEQLQEAYSTAEHKNQELVQAQRALKQVVKDLEQSNSELDAFAYIASHDLKEPLRGIHNYAAFLHEDYRDKLDDDGRDKLKTLQRLTQRLEMFIDSLLYFSRVGRVNLAVGKVDLDEVLDEVVDSLRISLDEQDVTIRVPQPLPTVECDRVRVMEVFRNLISNAMKYNDKPVKWIEIGCRDACEEDLVHGIAPKTKVFYIRDNGIGIPEKHIKTIFRMFKRLHGRDKYGGGTGAGIAIVKKIIERHKGRVWVVSTPGEGTTFCFTLEGSVSANVKPLLQEESSCRE